MTAPSLTPSLTPRAVTLRAVSVPLARPLVTRIVTIEAAPLLLIDLDTEEGITGRAYLFGYVSAGPRYIAPLISDLVARFKGRTLAPNALWDLAGTALSLFGWQGLTAIAVSGLDMAFWDAAARAANKPLAELIGGAIQPIDAYNSNGLGIIDASQAAEESQALIAEGGYRAVKIRVGRQTAADDIAVVRAVRDAVGGDVACPCDFNQCLDVAEAIRRGRALDDEGLMWIEEPIRYDDLAGNAEVAAAVATPISIGENFFGPQAMQDAITAKAADFMMPDAGRIGGVTGWLRAAAMAEAAGIKMSSHLYPEISAHLLAATPTRHWLEYVDWAAPILADPPRVAEGTLTAPQTLGTGIDWNEDAVAKYKVDL
ncbi:MAG: mandelate racemase [Alphaproteobacteria bacterium]|nr:mandelate racemase [Alphaproteobacteria bacterium]MCZ6764714.1 mandelate racemase [Alphaproteobacteria bacterium]